MKHRSAAKAASLYDPPRAGMWSRWGYDWDELKQSVLFHRLRPAGRLKAWDVVAGLICPGYSCALMGWKLMGRIALAAYALAWLGFLATLGQGWSNLALGLLLSAHAIS